MSAESALPRSWLGRRVVVRRLASTRPGGAPAYSDALGELIALTDEAAVVDTRRGHVTIPRDAIEIARLVTPSPAAVLALEQIAARGWQAADTELTDDGWLLRADSGWTGRANSALPLRTLTRPLADVLAELAHWYGTRGLRPVVAVPFTVATGLDRALAELSWTTPEDSHVMISRLDLLAAALAGCDPAAVDIVETPDRSWLAAYRYRGAPLPAGARDLLVRHERVGFAAIRDEGDVVANARAVVDAQYLGVTAVGTRPDRRRRGLARQVTRALVDWGREHGATHCYLQVSAANTAAIALYEGMGFYVHHSYHYRTPPTIEG